MSTRGYAAFVKNMMIYRKCTQCKKMALYCDQEGNRVRCKEHAEQYMVSALNHRMNCKMCMFLHNKIIAGDYCSVSNPSEKRCGTHKLPDMTRIKFAKIDTRPRHVHVDRVDTCTYTYTDADTYTDTSSAHDSTEHVERVDRSECPSWWWPS